MASKVHEKVMAIIYSDKGKFLLLRTNPKTMKLDGWYVVTGGVEKGERFEDAVKREVDEETGLSIIKISRIQKSFDYEWPIGSRKMHHEEVFLVKVKHSDVKFTRYEHLDYKWVSKEEFIKDILWWNGKGDLRKIVGTL